MVVTAAMAGPEAARVVAPKARVAQSIAGPVPRLEAAPLAQLTAGLEAAP